MTALGTKRDEPKVRFYLGSLYDLLGRETDAVREFKTAIELDPAFAEAYNYLGYMFAESGKNLDEALELAAKAVELQPDNGAFIDSLGWAYFKKGMTAEALVELEKAVKSEPDDPTIRDHLGDVYFKKGLRDKAREEWKRSLEYDPQQKKIEEKLKGN